MFLFSITYQKKTMRPHWLNFFFFILLHCVKNVFSTSKYNVHTAWAGGLSNRWCIPLEELFTSIISKSMFLTIGLFCVKMHIHQSYQSTDRNIFHNIMKQKLSMTFETYSSKAAIDNKIQNHIRLIQNARDPSTPKMS